MSKFSWDDHPVVNSQQSSGKQKFSWDDHPVVSDDKPSVGASAVRQFAQGATGGMSDEMAGGLEAVGRMLGVKGAGGPMKNISLAEDGPTISGDELKKAYEMGRDHERATLAKDSEANPGTSLAANIAGGAMSPINKLTKGMSAVKAGATMGATYGFGTSDADNIEDVAWDTAKGAGTGAVIGKGLDKISKFVAPAAESAASKISPSTPKLNKDEIIAAADRLGIKVTPGMLDDSGFVERLESSLAKSPSLMGQSIARKQRAVTDALADSVQEVTKDATNLSPYQVGEKFKSGVNAKVAERLDPISTVFDEVSKSTKFIPISDRSKNAIINNIKNTDAYSLTAGAGKPSQYVDMIGRLNNADQVKTTMTMLNADIRAAQGAEKQVLIEIKNKLSSLEDNSITRAAISQAREGGMQTQTGKKIGMEVVGDLKDARTGYRELSEDLKGLAENARVKSNKGPSAFLDAVEQIPSERVQDKFFNVENNRALKNLQEKFPEQFDLLRQGKLKEIADSAVDNTSNGQGRISTQKFVNEIRNLTPEARQLLFNESNSVIDDVSTIHKSLPRNFNPSGTASEHSFQEALYRNAKDIPNYLLYKGASSNLGKKIGDGLTKIEGDGLNAVRDVTASAAQKISSPASMLSASEVATKTPLKGYEKWAQDGADRIKDFDDSVSSDELEKLKKTKKGQDLLLRAAALPPKSKSLDKIVKQIRSGSLNGED